MLTEERTYTMEEIERETGLDRRTIAYYVQEGLLPKVGRRGPRTRYSRPFLDRLLFIQKIRGLQDQGLLGNYTLDDIREIFETVPEHLIADIVTGKEPLEIAPSGGTLRQRPAAALGSPRQRVERLRRLSERQRLADGSSETESGPPEPSSWSRLPVVLQSPGFREAYLRRPVRTEDDSFDAPAASGPPPEVEALSPPKAAAEDDSRIFIDLDEAPVQLELRRVAEEEDLESPAPPLLRQAPLPEPPHPLVRLLARLDRAAGQAPKGAIAESWTRAEVTPGIVLTVRGLDQESAPLLERVARLLRGLIEANRGKDGG